MPRSRLVTRVINASIWQYPHRLPSLFVNNGNSCSGFHMFSYHTRLKILTTIRSWPLPQTSRVSPTITGFLRDSLLSQSPRHQSALCDVTLVRHRKVSSLAVQPRFIYLSVMAPGKQATLGYVNSPQLAMGSPIKTIRYCTTS